MTHAIEKAIKLVDAALEDLAMRHNQVLGNNAAIEFRDVLIPALHYLRPDTDALGALDDLVIAAKHDPHDELDAKAIDANAETIRAALMANQWQPIEDAYDMIGYLLPLAKGYVASNSGIRSTECIIEDAEAMMSRRPQPPKEG